MNICVKYVFLCQERPSISQVRDTAVPNVICRLLVHVLGLEDIIILYLPVLVLRALLYLVPTCIGTEDIIILYLPVLVLRALLYLVPTCVGLEGIIISCTYVPVLVLTHTEMVHCVMMPRMCFGSSL